MPAIEPCKTADRPCLHFREINARSKLDFLCSHFLQKLIDNNFQLNLLIQVSPPKPNILKSKKKTFSKIYETFKKKLQNFRRERDTRVARFGLYKVESWSYQGRLLKRSEKTIQTLSYNRNPYYLDQPDQIKENVLLSKSINLLKSRSQGRSAGKSSGLQANISSLNFENQSKKEASSFRIRTISARMQIQAIFSREFPMRRFWASGKIKGSSPEKYLQSEVMGVSKFPQTNSELQRSDFHKPLLKNSELEETQIQSKPSLCETNASRFRGRSDRFQLKSIRIPVEEHRIFKLRDILTPSSVGDHQGLLDGGGELGGSRSRSRKRLVIPRYSSLDRKKKRKIRSLLGQYVQESRISLVDSKKVSSYAMGSC